MKFHIKNYLLFIWLKVILLTMLTGDAKGINNQNYPAVIDRIDNMFATILIEDIGIQCTILTANLPQRANTLEQFLINVIYNEQNDTCEFVSLDYIKTTEREKTIKKLQHNLRQRNKQ